MGMDVSHEGWTALTRVHGVSYNLKGYMHIVKVLLAAGVEKDNANEYGAIPLIMTADQGYY